VTSILNIWEWSRNRERCRTDRIDYNINEKNSKL
jgi:hypothetical protein